MRFGPIMFMLLLIELLLVVFGYIDSNSFVGVLLGEGSFKEMFNLTSTGLLSTSNLIGAAGTAFGLILKNNYLIFAGFVLFTFDLVFGISGIVAYFPTPFGEILYGIIAFIFTWMALEWWRLRDY